jgi:hypothetical protein
MPGMITYSAGNSSRAPFAPFDSWPDHSEIHMLEFLPLSQVTGFLGEAAGPMIGRAAGSVIGKQLGKIVGQAGERRKAAEACAHAFDLWLASLYREYERSSRP